MKHLTERNILIIVSIVAIIGAIVTSSYVVSLQDAYAEAIQPSKIEVQKVQLTEKEKTWVQKEEIKQNCINTIQEIDIEKETLEGEIHNLRNEILGL